MKKQPLLMGTFSLISSLSVLAQTPVTSFDIQTSTVPTGSTSFTKNGHIGIMGDCFSKDVSHTVKFYQPYSGDAAPTQKIIKGFSVGSDAFKPISSTSTKPYDKINLVRVNNFSYLGDYFSGFFEYTSVREAATGYSYNPTLIGTDLYSDAINGNTSKEIYINANFVNSMEALLNQFSINYGSDNVFSNQGRGNNPPNYTDNEVRTGNNIERIDLIFKSGVAGSTTSALEKLGFMLVERGGNDVIKVAAITSLGTGDVVSGLGNLVNINAADWGASGPLIKTAVFMGPTSDIKPKQQLSAQPVAGVYISLAQLGIPVGTKIYGISIFPGDFDSSQPDKINLTASNTHTWSTFDNGTGGLDILSGAFFAREENTFEVIAQTLSGKVWNDANGNGLTDGGENNVSGNSSSSSGSVVTGSNIYVNIIVGNKIVAVVPVQADGSYSYNAMLASTEYKLILSDHPGTIGGTTPSSSTPNGWTSTKENLDGIVDNATPGIIEFTSPSGGLDVVNYDFGLQRPPLAEAKSYSVANAAFSTIPPAGYPSLPAYQTIPMTSSNLTGYPTQGSLSGSDPEDCTAASACNTGTGTTFKIESIRSNTKLYYNFGSGPVEINTGSGAVTIPNFDASKMVIYALGGAGTAGNEIGFTYSITDKAEASSSPVPYTIITSSPLPVRLLSFNIAQKKDAIALNWVTSTEQNNKGFGIEHSTNGTDWRILNFESSKAASGNSISPLYYQFFHTNPNNGKNLYRLIQTDFDGTTNYSRVQMLIYQTGNIRIWPNPAKDLVQIDGLSNNSNIRIYDLAGRLMAEQKTNKSFIEISLRDLSEGTYQIQILNADGFQQLTHKLIKSK